MSEKRVTPVHAIRAINPLRATHIRRTYFQQIQQWRTMSEQYAKARKYREALAEADKDKDKD